MSGNSIVAFTSVGRGPLAWSPRPEGYGPQCLLVRSRAAWGKIAGSFDMNPQTVAPGAQEALGRVDFATQSILVVTLGEAGSTGFDIELKRIEAGPPPVLVIQSTRPAPDVMTGAMMTHPFHLVILQATGLPPDAVFLLDGKKTEFERHVLQ